jgi:glycerol-3-phosphate dehydrogenase (NAD(P)+)
MVVEGAYTCISALQLSRQLDIPMPITETVYKILYEQLKPMDAVMLLMKRPIKEEHQ